MSTMHRALCALVPAAGLALATLPAPAAAQDAAAVSPGTTQVLFENQYIRVIKSTFAKGALEATHSHPPGWYYVTSGGTLAVTPQGGKPDDWKPATGENAWDPGEGPHTSLNTGDTTLQYIYVEVKAAAKP